MAPITLDSGAVPASRLSTVMRRRRHVGARRARRRRRGGRRPRARGLAGGQRRRGVGRAAPRAADPLAVEHHDEATGDLGAHGVHERRLDQQALADQAQRADDHVVDD